MRKYVLSLLLLMIAAAAMCQKKSKVNLISSSKSEGVKRNGVDVIKVYNGVWNQGLSRMRSDSGYFYPNANAFEAYGHVNINQGDTLNIYSDKLNYDGNTKIAILTDNVRMVDKETTLTTNYFTYSTATRIGTYTNGGKIVNKQNTLTSQNGYYFAGTHDAYFRYNVVCVTSDALIKTDTMRYNSKTRINYFYGPTHIYGNKDKDTLYTEDGTYDTKTEQATFWKNNLYSQGTKTLKGDSLFYDRVKGYGRAVDHVVFNDNEQKIAIRGGLGTYFKKNDLTIVTRDPYVILVTEDKDTTKNDTANKHLPQLSKKDSLSKLNKKQAAQIKKAVNDNKNAIAGLNNLPLNTIPIKGKVIDSVSKTLAASTDVGSLAGMLPIPNNVNIDSAKKIALAQSKKIDKATQKKLKQAAKNALKTKLDTNELVSNKRLTAKDTGRVKRDSVYMSADTIETRILTYKELKKIQEDERIAHIRDTSKIGKKVSIIYKTSPKFLTLDAPKLAKDTSYYLRNYFGPPKPKVQPKQKKAKVQDTTLKKNVKVDSTFLNRKIVLTDTTRVRIIMAFHFAKIFKSDLQAKADSIFYSNSDSTIRCYVKPMIWTQGSQLSGDTIYMQMRNKKLDNMDLFPNSFIVNLEKNDSTHFNQVGGKKMRGFFKNDKLSRMYVDGNAESIYFAHDSATNKVTDMERSFSSRLRVYLRNNEATELTFLTKPDHRIIPIEQVKEDDKILKGFIWKPKDRPISKESIIPSYNKKYNAAKPNITGIPKPKNGKTGKGISANKKPPGNKSAPDSTLNKSVKNLPVIKAKGDSTLKNQTVKPAPISAGKDTSAIKPPVIGPTIKAQKDSTSNKQ